MDPTGKFIIIDDQNLTYTKISRFPFNMVFTLFERFVMSMFEHQ